MKEVFEIASEIENCIKALERLCRELDKIGMAKVDAQVNYDKEFQIALEQLKTEGSAVSTREKEAKGILATNGTTRILGLAEIRYKALHTKIEAAKSAMNGWQSINKYLSVM